MSILNSNNLRKKSGFSIIELSIVILVLGLLISSVVAGRAIIQNSRVQSLLNEARQYQIALITFRDAFGDWPGSLRADQRVGDISVSTGGYICPVATTNNCVDFNIGYFPLFVKTNGTTIDRFGCKNMRDGFKSMALANLIKGVRVDSTSAPSATTYSADAGLSLPIAFFSDKAIWTYGSTNIAKELEDTTIKDKFGDGMFLVLQGRSCISTACTCGNTAVGTDDGARIYPAISSEMAYKVDVKIDDGLPSQGSVLGFKAGSDYCTDKAAYAAADAIYGNNGSTDAAIAGMCAIGFYVQGQ